MYSSLLLAFLAPTLLTAARIHSLPEDTHAFPKYRVTFLNGLPVLNDTAERWLRQGLRGGDAEFLDQPWQEDPSQTTPLRKEIGSGDIPVDTPATDSRSFASANYTIEHMKMGPKGSYVCYIPKPSESASTRQQEETETDATPARSWSLLQPLSGTCLYHRQGWFTYSYCHNKAIRQFKELAQPPSRLPAGTYTPEEDPEWESYTLGRAPRSAEETGADLTVAERNAQAANLELARNTGSRYLVQRWGDGTLCDVTGKPREVEVQFHCSMVTTDHILFVKEAKTCSYVLVIHTPRLCGEPGFKSKRDSGEETPIRCREVVEALPPRSNLSPPSKVYYSEQPFRMPQRKTVLPTLASEEKTNGPSSPDGSKSKEDIYSEFVRQAVQALLQGTVGSKGDEKSRQGEADDDSSSTFKQALEAGEVVEFEIPPYKLIEALRAAGEVRSESRSTERSGKNKGNRNSGSASKKGGDEEKDHQAREHVEL